MKKNKLITCRHCGLEIAASAKVCPHCGGRNKHPIYKNWWFGVIIAIILISAIGSGGRTKSSKKTSEVPISTQTTATQENTTVSQSEEAKIPENTKEEDNVPGEYKSALAKAEMYVSLMHMSKQGVFDQLTSEYGEKFPEDAAQYAIDKLDVDWNANALAKAEDYNKTMSMSKKGIYAQLTSEYGEKFTADEAQYAVDNVKTDWNANALEKAKTYQSTMSMSKSAIYDQLISEYGEQFTADEAQYAVDNLG